MTTYFTKEPLGSTSPYVLFDNAQNFDYALNDITRAIWKDRFGRGRKTIWGMEQDFLAQLLNQEQRFNNFIRGSGYKVVGEYTSGPLTVTDYNQLIRYQNEFWKLTAATNIPFKTTGNDATSWAVDSVHFVSAGDAALRQQIADPDGATKTPELQIARWCDDGDVRGWGADSGATDNTAAFRAARQKHKAIRVPDKFNIGTTTPDFNMLGAGSVVSDGIIVILDELTYDPAKENVLFTPGTYLREKTGESYPTRQNPDFDGHCYRFVLSQGSKLSDEVKRLAWITAVGNTIGCDPEEWQMIDVFGTNAMIYAGRVSRNTALGSEVMAWFGARSQADLIKNRHDYWRKPDGNKFLPGEPGWNAADLETQFPGIGQRLADFTGYVTDPEQAGYCTGVGRDALNHIVAGVRNTGGGYGALQHLFFGNFNTGFGALALQSMVFGDGNSALGDGAGRYANDCANTTFLGYGAGRDVRGAQSSVFIGDRTADGVKAATRAVIIGPEAGRNHPTNLDNKLLIANQPYGGNLPLISGDFTPNNLGVNILPENIRARLHVRYASSGSTLTPQVGALIEGSTTAALTIETANTGFGQIRFADPDGISPGFIEYSHSSNSMTFGTDGTGRVRVEATGAFVPMVDNSYLLGRAAFRWATVYAGTGSINTSDERDKDRLEILAAEKKAALEIKADIWKFKFHDAIAEKGIDGARYHFGVGAQSVADILRKHDLDPEMYAFYCYDEWEDEYKTIPEEKVEHPAIFSSLVDEKGNQLISKEAWVEVIKPEEKILVKAAGSRYGIRYEELLCFIMAAI